MSSRIALGWVLMASVLVFSGCSGGDEEMRTLDENDNVTNTDPPEAHAHHHDEGPHGGHILEFGAYHGEIAFNDGVVSVYVLGDDAETAVPLEGASAKLILKSEEETQEIALTASPQDGEAEGSTSRFVSEEGALPEGIDDIEKIEGSVELTTGGETMTASIEHDHHHDH